MEPIFQIFFHNSISELFYGLLFSSILAWREVKLYRTKRQEQIHVHKSFEPQYKDVGEDLETGHIFS